MPVKRAGSSSSAQQKRTRFADPSADSTPNPEDTELLEEDLPENGAKTRAREKKSLKDTDGYGSDSSNDEEGVVPSRRPGKEGDGDGDEDMDMFGDVEEKKEEQPSKPKKEFMNLEEIEGQEFNPSDEDSDSEAEAERQTRKQGLDGPMGFDITPFNMKNEMDEGRFTADGETYQANEKDEGDAHDTWLEGLDKDAVKKARRAQRERERIEKEREEREEGEDGKEKENKMLREAVDLMERGETVLEALQRLGKDVEKARKGKSWAERQKERKEATSNPFTQLSEIVSGLTSLGHLDVYSLTKESIQRMLPKSDPSPAPPTTSRADNRQFQYRFSMGYVKSLPEAQRPVEREIFGPFSVGQLIGWRNTGFFGGPACENVELRAVGTDTWGSWQDVI